MRKLLLAGAAVAATLVATPALAQTNAGFVGPRVEVQAGLPDVDNDDVTYGVVAGADAPIGDRLTIGADVNATDFLKEDHRQLGAGVRVGYALNPNTQAFARAGYVNLPGNTEGLQAGGGFNFRLNGPAYLNTEYRYTNYNQGATGHGLLLGLGIRF